MRSLRTVLWGVLAVAVGCDAKLAVKTSTVCSDSSLAESCLSSDKEGGAVTPFEVILENHEHTTSLNQIEVAWNLGGAQRQKVAYQVELASSAACLDAVAKREVRDALGTTLSDLSEGTYYICLKATFDGTEVVARNNAVKVVVDRSAPVIGALPDLERNAPVALGPVVTDVSNLTFAWDLASGPGAVSFSERNQQATVASFAQEGL